MLRRVCVRGFLSSLVIVTGLVLTGCPIFGRLPTSLTINNDSTLTISVVIFQDMLMAPEIVVGPNTVVEMPGYFDQVQPVGGGRFMFGEYRVIVSNSDGGGFLGECESVRIYPEDLLTVTYEGGAAGGVFCSFLDLS